VISLSQDFTSLTGTAPLAISSAPPTVGQGLQLVGFGCDSAGCGPGQGNGIKRSGSTVVADVGATLFDFNGSQAQIGAGDWGGPAFTSSCEVGVMLGVSGGLYQLLRVDAKVSWVQSVSGDNTVVTCGQPVCGDGVCQSPETHASCPADCALCGDGVCQSPETHANCPADCALCGDGVCQSPENGQTCPQDCGQCGNLANGTACDPGCCVGYGTCQNGLCTTQGGHCCNTHSCCFL
jgi:hypothetical protein